MMTVNFCLSVRANYASITLVVDIIYWNTDCMRTSEIQRQFAKLKPLVVVCQVVTNCIVLTVANKFEEKFTLNDFKQLQTTPPAEINPYLR